MILWLRVESSRESEVCDIDRTAETLKSSATCEVELDGSSKLDETFDTGCSLSFLSNKNDKVVTEMTQKRATRPMNHALMRAD